jgi:carbon-monoxide dehydrogenase medium subunit
VGAGECRLGVLVLSRILALRVDLRTPEQVEAGSRGYKLTDWRGGVKAPRFNYVRAESVEHVLGLLAEHGEEARILAGGQSLMPTLNMRLSQPKLLIDINRLAALEGISLRGDNVRIGALARHVAVANSPIVAEHLPLIAEAMPHVAHVAVRNRGTFGGSIALADPAAELPACALALGATFVVKSAKGRREIAAADYFRGLYETARRPDELFVEALVPVKRPGHVPVFMELARRHGDFALAGVAFNLEVAGGVVTGGRLAASPVRTSRRSRGRRSLLSRQAT